MKKIKLSLIALAVASTFTVSSALAEIQTTIAEGTDAPAAQATTTTKSKTDTKAKKQVSKKTAQNLKNANKRKIAGAAQTTTPTTDMPAGTNDQMKTSDAGAGESTNSSGANSTNMPTTTGTAPNTAPAGTTPSAADAAASKTSATTNTANSSTNNPIGTQSNSMDSLEPHHNSEIDGLD